jgi:hypothetical protein
MDNKRPVWLPDTPGFLAIAILGLVALIVIILLTHPPEIDERTSGVLMTIIGVIIACMKDVFSYFFGSSKGSEKKDDAMISKALESTPPGGGMPPTPVSTTTTVTDNSTVTKTEPAAPIAPMVPAQAAPVSQA